MAIYQQGNTYGKFQLRPGARGEKVDGRINRSNHTLNTAPHEATNIKYGMDDRLHPEFKYGYAAGYNQMLAAKGRVVAVDPYLTIFDADTQKYDNALTLANGGVDVKFDKATGHWTALGDSDSAFVIDAATGKDSTRPEDVRPANIPIGILLRNEYTRDYNALNGITPGAVNTDCMTELPYFVGKDKALDNPWGSAYAEVNKALKPGDLVKPDATGRVVISPLSDERLASLTAAQIEAERQQVIGQVYEVRKELVPMGAAKYAQWALSDILEFEEFNPDLKRKTNRTGEDNIEDTPYKVDGKAPFGYEKTFNESDLHMLGLDDKGVSRQAYNQRMQHKYRFDFGIPGLTDGHNAVKKVCGPETLGEILAVAGATGTVFTYRVLNTAVEPGSIKIGATVQDGVITGGTAAVVGATLASGKLEIVYVNEMQGIIQIKVKEDLTEKFAVTACYEKRGEAGVPTHLDWDGCVGTVKILLQK